MNMNINDKEIKTANRFCLLFGKSIDTIEEDVIIRGFCPDTSGLASFKLLLAEFGYEPLKTSATVETD